MYKRGDTVRIARDLYDDGSCDFVGKVGTVTGTVGTSVTVNGISDEHPNKSWGFDPDELERA